MKGYAKFLNFIAAIVFWLLILATAAIAAAAGVLVLKPDLLQNPAVQSAAPITVNGQPIDPALLQQFMPALLIIFGLVLLILILTLVTISRIRTALKEVSLENPFSMTCSKALHTAAALELVTGLISIGLSVYAAIALGGLTLNGSGTMSISMNLSFILVAVFLKMLAKISEYGRR